MVKAIRIVLCLLVMLVALDSISAPGILEKMASGLGRKSSKDKSKSSKKGSDTKLPKSKSAKGTSECDHDNSGSNDESSPSKAAPVVKPPSPVPPQVVPSPSPAAPQQVPPSTDGYFNPYGSSEDSAWSLISSALENYENSQTNNGGYAPNQTTDYHQPSQPVYQPPQPPIYHTPPQPVYQAPSGNGYDNGGYSQPASIYPVPDGDLAVIPNYRPQGWEIR